jgi:hypothetical protein
MLAQSFPCCVSYFMLWQPTSSKASTKGGGQEKRAYVEMSVSKARGVKKVS